MKVYKENIRRCEAFYESNYYSVLKENDYEFIEIIFDELCLDADACDMVLYAELANKYNMISEKCSLVEYIDGEKIVLSADVICGRKQLAKFRNFDYILWIDDYKTIRSNLDYHFIWPRHKLPTINTYRYQIYKDRIDCLLYDLKCFFEGAVTPMEKAYKNDNTKIWLKKFSNFKDFIEKMRLEKFVNSKFEVLDISKNDGSVIKKYIRGEELTKTIPEYLENVLMNSQKNF